MSANIYFLQTIALTMLIMSASSFAQSTSKLFDGNSDVGAVLHRGSVMYDGARQQYIISGSGANIWGSHDEFHFAWKKLGGDFILQAHGKLIGKGVDPHRKTGWMVRNSLDSSSPMVSVQIHGDGLVALQYRKTTGGAVEEVRSTVKGPDVFQLERRGNRYIMSVARFGEPFTTADISDINLGDEVYAGLFVCAHNKDVTEKAIISNVRIIKPVQENFVPYKDYIGSHIETLEVFTGQRTILYTDPGSLQAPNWTPDGKALIYNTSKGSMYRFDLKSRKSEMINTDFVKKNNNDHVLSFDGKMLGLSASSGKPEYGSLIYTVPVQGGKPKQITPIGPSYLHGWSPDGKYLVFTGQRDNEFDIYKISSDGGEELRLTDAPGLDDGPEYSPDGKYIYFNSVRTGKMQLWRMKPDGSDQEQLTFDDYNNWFPHISPDGQWIAFLTFMNDIDPSDHPFYRHVYLRLMPAGGGQPKVIAYVYGGQGSINTPSWAPNSKRIAFVSNNGMISATSK
ncbi:biopolymer transporter TolR [Chitinophagaceae bacterium LB-8]|uniref:Biopolymer transporter TolR n=1 Tax=Paraflavisolibacter caeni TaxID=2982496 RepID=A0A9X3BFT9_9BACT|nr:biopolymer transporter TolR [Paraflavisolibacter caeni]MCU7549639.1 biopolymer transporter TolR [Paraflavisolibacter caeni]